MGTKRPQAELLHTFFLLAYGISWTVWLGMIIVERATGTSIPAYALFISPIGPVIAAIALTWREGGKAGLRHLFGQALKVRIGWYWYPLVLLLYPLLVSGVTAGAMKLFTAGEVPVVLDLSPGLVVGFLFISLYVLLMEELGWRGYALPRLQRRYSALKSSVIVGVLWGTWHLPIWILQPERAWGGPLLLAFLLFVLGCVAASVLYTCVFNGTGGSVLLVALLHGVDNVLLGWLWVGEDAYALPWMGVVVAVQAVMGALLVWRFGAAHLSPREKVTFAGEAWVRLPIPGSGGRPHTDL